MKLRDKIRIKVSSNQLRLPFLPGISTRLARRNKTLPRRLHATTTLWSSKTAKKLEESRNSIEACGSLYQHSVLFENQGDSASHWLFLAEAGLMRTSASRNPFGLKTEKSSSASWRRIWTKRTQTSLKFPNQEGNQRVYFIQFERMEDQLKQKTSKTRIKPAGNPPWARRASSPSMGLFRESTKWSKITRIWTWFTVEMVRSHQSHLERLTQIKKWLAKRSQMQIIKSQWAQESQSTSHLPNFQGNRSFILI